MHDQRITLPSGIVLLLGLVLDPPIEDEDRFAEDEDDRTMSPLTPEKSDGVAPSALLLQHTQAKPKSQTGQRAERYAI